MVLIKLVRGFIFEFGENCFLVDNVIIIGDVKMGQNCSIWFSIVLRGDVNLICMGDGVNIQDGSVLYIFYEKLIIEIGNYVLVGYNVIIYGVIVKDYVLIGMGLILFDYVVIGEGVIVVVGLFVLSNIIIELGSIWGGVLVKFIKKVDLE